MTQGPSLRNCRRGTVVSTSGTGCTVEFLPQRCSDCSGHCALSVFGPAALRLTMQSRDRRPTPPVGSEVWVTVPERAILRAAFGVFGLPLFGLIGGAAGAAALGLADAFAAGAAGSGLAAGFLAGAFAVRRGPVAAATLYDGRVERPVTLNQAASMRSDARSALFNTGISRIT
jgi:positive regulator of sigma E activity